MNTFKDSLAISRQQGKIVSFPNLIAIDPDLQRMLLDLDQHGAYPLIVGGAVRDALFGVQSKDVDVEVFGATINDIVDAAARCNYEVDAVGRSFGVIKLYLANGQCVDLCIPRQENRIGSGHKDFSTEFNPDIHPELACSRRDFTMNAMMWDPIQQELHDYFGGRQDISDRVLRATTQAYKEDALRVLRGMYFIGRFGLTATEDTINMSREMASDFKHISVERVFEEWLKFVQKANHPRAAMLFLDQAGWIDFFPELKNLKGIPQDDQWHPEGDVWTHTLHVMDAAAEIASREKLSNQDKAVLMFAAITHDLGKPSTTKLRDKKGTMRWTAYGHEAASGPLAEAFLARIGIPKSISERVIPLVVNHMAPHMAKDDNGVSAKMVRKLSERCFPSNIIMLSLLCESDVSGRPPLVKGRTQAIQKLLDKATDQNVLEKPMEKLIKGQDLIDRGFEPGPNMGEWIRRAWEAQQNGDFTLKTEAELWLDRQLPKKRVK